MKPLPRPSDSSGPRQPKRRNSAAWMGRSIGVEHLRRNSQLAFSPRPSAPWGLAMRRICCSARENCRITVSNSILAFHLLGSSRTSGFRASAVRVGRQKAGATKPVLIAASIAPHTGQRRRESSNARRVGRQEAFHPAEGWRNRLSSYHNASPLLRGRTANAGGRKDNRRKGQVTVSSRVS